MMTKQIILLLAVCLIMIPLISASADKDLEPVQKEQKEGKFAYLDFLEDRYVSECNNLNPCRICVNITQTSEVVCTEGYVQNGITVDVVPSLKCDAKDCKVTFSVTDPATKAINYLAYVTSSSTTKPILVNESQFVKYEKIKNNITRTSNFTHSLETVEIETEQAVYKNIEVKKYIEYSKDDIKIPTINEDYKEYATWTGTGTAALSTKLMNVYKWADGNDTLNNNDLSLMVNNGHVFTTPGADGNTFMNFTTTNNQYKNNTYWEVSSSGGFSFSGWFKTKYQLQFGDAAGLIVSFDNWGSYIQKGFAIEDDCNAMWTFGTGNAAQFYTNDDLGDVCDDKWHSFVATHNTTHDTLYIDGLKIQQHNSGTLAASAVDQIVIGQTIASSYSYKGGIDEIYVWNRTLTESEALSLNTSFYQLDTPDITKPQSNISINATTIKYANTINITLNVSDETGLSHCWFYNNVSNVNSTPITLSGTSGTCYNLTYITSPKGTDILFIGYVNDTSNNLNFSQRVITVQNTLPNTPSSIKYLTTGGFTTSPFTYNQIMDSINATCTTDADNDLQYCNITVFNPDGTRVVDNKKMSNVSNVYNYSADFTLDSAGTWTTSISAFDGTNISTSSNTFDVTITTPTIFNGYYAYDYLNLPTQETINSDFANYTFDSIGLQLNFSNFNTNYSAIKTRINDSKIANGQKSFLRIFFDGTGNYSSASPYTNNTCGTLNQNLTDFRVSPFDEAIAFILISLNESQEYKVNFTNKIAQCIVNATSNKFPVYTTYYNESLNTNWVTYYSIPTITAATNVSFINAERIMTGNTTSLTRVYYGLNSNLKQLARNYHYGVITKIRGTITAQRLINSSLVDISNGDLIIFNNESAQPILFNISNGTVSRAGKDVWDATNKAFIEKDTDEIINITLPGLSFAYIYIDNIDHLTLRTVQGSNTLSNQFYGWNRSVETQGSYSIVGANDAMFYAYDPTYDHSRQFFHHYEWINTSFVTNYTPYCNNGVVVISDYNAQAINNTIGTACLNNTFGYISVADYADSDAWSSAKQAEIDVWINNYGINIFLDGLDSGVSGNNFATRFSALITYIQITKGKKAITNDYTSYSTVGVGGLGNYDMKESFCGRWDGTVGSPTYSFESYSVDYTRAVWARTNNNLQLLMTFGDRLDTSKMMYCYAKYLVWYGDGGLYRYAQPNFQAQHEIFTFNPGTQQERTWTEVNSTYHYRRYSNGKVWVNPQDNQSWGIEDNRLMNNLTFCVKAQIYAASPAASTSINISVNGIELTPISYTEIDGAQWATNDVCRDITTMYNITGKYAIRLHSQVPGNPTGLNIYNTKTNRTGVFSFYDSSTTNPPADGSILWSAYGRTGANLNYETTNWFTYLISNSTTSSQIDDGITDIQQYNVSGRGKINLTINSSKSYNIEVWSDIFTVPGIINITYWNGTAETRVYPLNTSTCNSTNPIFNSTVIGSETHKACMMNSNSQILIRLGIPSLSDRQYNLNYNDDTISPVVNYISPANNTKTNNQNVTFVFNVTDLNPDSIIVYLNNSKWHYQEFANRTTNPMLYETGLYAWTNTPWFGAESNTRDGLWNRAGATVSSTGQFFINYTKPDFALSDSLWMVKDENATVNLTIPSDCWDYNPTKLMFKAESAYDFALNTSWYCFNGTWKTLRYADLVHNDVYEEAMWWHIYFNKNVSAVYSSNELNTTSAILPDGVYTWNIRANDTYGNIGWFANNYTLTVDTTAPVISIISPLNNTIVSSSSSYTDFYYNVSDLTDINYCSMYLNNVLISMNTGITKGIQQSFTNILIANRNNTWFLRCQDNVSNIINSSVYNFTFVQSTSSGTGGASSGGGSSTAPSIQYTISPKTFSINIQNQTSIKSYFKITNNEKYSALIFQLTTDMYLSTSLFTLNPGESKNITFNMSTGLTRESKNIDVFVRKSIYSSATDKIVVSYYRTATPTNASIPDQETSTVLPEALPSTTPTDSPVITAIKDAFNDKPAGYYWTILGIAVIVAIYLVILQFPLLFKIPVIGAVSVVITYMVYKLLQMMV